MCVVLERVAGRGRPAAGGLERYID